MPRDQIDQQEIDFDQNGSIYPLNSIFHHFEEEFQKLEEEFQKLGDDKPAKNVTGGSFAVVESDDAK